MQRIKVYSLFDISKTNVVRNFKADLVPYTTATGVLHNVEEWTYARRQQRNYETLMQILSLRIQPLEIIGPVKNVELVERLGFGDQYNGKYPVWTLEFSNEVIGALQNSESSTGMLVDDSNSVPMLLDLDEGDKLPAYINTMSDEKRNVYFIEV